MSPLNSKSAAPGGTTACGDDASALIHAGGAIVADLSAPYVRRHPMARDFRHLECLADDATCEACGLPFDTCLCTDED